jgi:septal ring factor EnvC (AmiA/AmiB activator)
MSDFTRNMAPINRRVLEALKPMGRMDGDMATSGVDAASAAQTWRRECELLRREIEQLRIAGSQFQDERDKLSDLVSQQTAFIARLEALVKAVRQCVAERDEEIERLKAENDRLRMVARDETPRSLSEHSRESRPITCRLRIHGFISSHPVDTTIEF